MSDTVEQVSITTISANSSPVETLSRLDRYIMLWIQIFNTFQAVQQYFC